jgi:ribonuclease HI
VSKTNILDRKFKTVILNRTDIEPYIDSLDKDIWCIYTDGSKRDNLTGAGFCAIHNHQTVTSQAYPLGTFPSVFQCELFAIHEAALWVQANVTSPSTIIFFSDSQAAINTLNSTSVSNTIALDTINTLNTLGAVNSISIHWVPGHSNIAGNEAADTLANQGSAIRPIGPEPYLPFSKNQSDTEIRALTFSQHIATYKQNTLSDKGKTPLLIYLTRHKYKLAKLSSIQIKWLTWVLSGHSPLYYFQHKIGKVFSPYCPHCYGETETSAHYLGQCVRYATIRLRTFGHITMTWTELLSHTPALIIKYIASTDRFNSERIFTDRTIP